MPKRGEQRSDGKIYAYGAKYKGRFYEYWFSPEEFERRFPGERERAKAYKEKLTNWALTKKEREKVKKEKWLAYTKTLGYRIKFNRWRREQYAKNPEVRAKVREANRKRCEESKKAAAVRRAERLAAREAAEAQRRAEIEKRLMEREEKRLAKEAARAARPPKVVLTDEEKKRRRRDDKRNYKHRRRALLRGLESKVTAGELREAKAKCRGLCYYCRQKVKILTLDHVVPLAKGGSHTLDNIVFACHGCNSEKRDLDPHEYGAKHGLLLV